MAEAIARLPPGLLEQPAVATVLALLNGAGEEARLVGGAVRNALLGLPPGDIDVATTALPSEVMRRAAQAGIRAVPTGIAHGTVTLRPAEGTIEVTTLREDVDTDGRHATVRFGRDFVRDAKRRDFTINALYAKRDGTVVDHVDGLKDLAARHVRFIGDPFTRIREDYLRSLRLFRFHSEYGEGLLDGPAFTAAIRLRAGIARLSAERVRAEMMKLLISRRAGPMMASMAEAGFLDRILGGIADTRAFARLAAGAPPRDPLLGLAALAVFTEEDARRVANRLRLANVETGRLEGAARLLPALHARTGSIDAPTLRAMAYRHGVPAVRDALVIAALRQTAWPLPAPLAEAALVLDAPLPVCPWTGSDVLARGLAPGPRIKAVLVRAQDLWSALGFPADPAVHARLLDQAIDETAPGSIDAGRRNGEG